MPSVYIPVAFGSMMGTIAVMDAHLAIILDSIPPVGHKPLGEFLRWIPRVLYSWKGVYHAYQLEARLWLLEEARVLWHRRGAGAADSQDPRQALSRVHSARDGVGRCQKDHVGTPQRPTARSLSLLGAGGAIDPAPPEKPLDLDPSRNPPRGGSLLPPEIDPAALVIGDRTGDYGD